MNGTESDELSADTTEQQSRNGSVRTRDLVRSYFHLLDGTIPIHERESEPDATVVSLVDLLARKHSLSIITKMLCRDDSWRFNELKEALGVSPKTLSKRLSELVEAGLVSRQSYDEIPPRVEYEPTTKAKELTPASQFLYAWAEQYDLEPVEDDEPE